MKNKFGSAELKFTMLHVGQANALKSSYTNFEKRSLVLL